MPSWHLADADPIAASNKYTFYKPSRDLIAKVKPGEVVKLIFRFECNDPEAPGAERMWVMVDSINSDGSFTGRLDNEPAWIRDLKLNDRVTFDARHVINTEHDDPDNLVERYIKRCYVTNRILHDREDVGYLYREEPDRENDSGWRIMAGDETDTYMDNPDNSQYVSLGAVLSCDDSFIHLLDSPAGSAFAKERTMGKFSPVGDLK